MLKVYLKSKVNGDSDLTWNIKENKILIINDNKSARLGAMAGK